MVNSDLGPQIFFSWGPVSTAPSFGISDLFPNVAILDISRPLHDPSGESATSTKSPGAS
jgi:hypothetical protein